jgi:ribonuclease D
MRKPTSLDPYSGRMRLMQFSAPDGTAYIIDLDCFRDDGDALAPLRALLAAVRPVKVAHNAKFDAKWTKHQLGTELGGIFDTMLASQLVSAGESEDRHSLAAVAARYLDEAVDKSEQLSDWSGELTPAQLEYAARDAALMLPLRERLIELLKRDELVRVAQLEFECVVPVACLELARNLSRSGTLARAVSDCREAARYSRRGITGDAGRGIDAAIFLRPDTQ